MSSPLRSSSWVSSRACSSAVRTSTVDSRQWWARPAGSVPSRGTDSSTGAAGSSANRPTTVSVFPTSMASSMAFLSRGWRRSATGQSRRSSPRSSTGAEWVRAPADSRSAPAAARAGRGGEGRRRPTPRSAASTPAARTRATRLGHLVGAHVVEHDHGGTGGHRLVHLVEAVALHLDHAARATGAGPGPPPRRWWRPPRWLSLTSTASDRLPRWLWPPPARTAAFSRARRPGVVLRVSSTRVAGLAARTAST